MKTANDLKVKLKNYFFYYEVFTGIHLFFIILANIFY